MNFCIHPGSKRLVLPLQVQSHSVEPPRPKGLVVSRVFATAPPASAYIDLGPAGLSRPFAGGTWQYEVRKDGEGLWAIWVGIPDVILQAPPGDALVRMGLEAVADDREAGPGLTGGLHLAAVDLAVDAQPGPEAAGGAWSPDWRRPPFAA